MMLITKELAEAVLKAHTSCFGQWCAHCESWLDKSGDLHHEETCIVVRAKLLLKYEWGIEA